MFSHHFVLGAEYGFGAGFSIGDPAFVRKITMEDNNAGPILSLFASVLFSPFALKSMLAFKKSSKKSVSFLDGISMKPLRNSRLRPPSFPSKPKLNKPYG